MKLFLTHVKKNHFNNSFCKLKKCFCNFAVIFLHFGCRNTVSVYNLYTILKDFSTWVSVNRREPTEFLVPMSENERLLCPGVVQLNSVQCSSRSDVVNQLNWQCNSVSSSHSLPGFSSSGQPEIRDVPVYSHSHMPRREINPTLSHVPLPTANFSSGPYIVALVEKADTPIFRWKSRHVDFSLEKPTRRFSIEKADTSIFR